MTDRGRVNEWKPVKSTYSRSSRLEQVSERTTTQPYSIQTKVQVNLGHRSASASGLLSMQYLVALHSGGRIVQEPYSQEFNFVSTLLSRYYLGLGSWAKEIQPCLAEVKPICQMIVFVIFSYCAGKSMLTPMTVDHT